MQGRPLGQLASSAPHHVTSRFAKASKHQTRATPRLVPDTASSTTSAGRSKRMHRPPTNAATPERSKSGRPRSSNAPQSASPSPRVTATRASYFGWAKWKGSVARSGTSAGRACGSSSCFVVDRLSDSPPSPRTARPRAALSPDEVRLQPPSLRRPPSPAVTLHLPRPAPQETRSPTSQARSPLKRTIS
jgi:hypothetical protein